LLSPSKYQSRCIQLHNLAPEKPTRVCFLEIGELLGNDFDQPEIVGNNPHTAEAVCRESPEKPVNQPPMIVASSDDVFNESPTINACRQEESKLVTCGSFDVAHRRLPKSILKTPNPLYSTVPSLVSDPAPRIPLPGHRKMTSLSKASDLPLAPAVTARPVLTPMQRRKR
jgi:hypothetical protein